MPWLSFGLREGFRAKIAHALHISSNRSILTAPVGQVGRGSAGERYDASQTLDCQDFVQLQDKSIGRSYGSRETGSWLCFVFFFASRWSAGVRVLALKRILAFCHLSRAVVHCDLLFVLKLTGGAAAHAKKLAKTRLHSRSGRSASCRLHAIDAISKNGGTEASHRWPN